MQEMYQTPMQEMYQTPMQEMYQTPMQETPTPTPSSKKSTLKFYEIDPNFNFNYVKEEPTYPDLIKSGVSSGIVFYGGGNSPENKVKEKGNDLLNFLSDKGKLKENNGSDNKTLYNKTMEVIYIISTMNDKQLSKKNLVSYLEKRTDSTSIDKYNDKNEVDKKIFLYDFIKNNMINAADGPNRLGFILGLSMEINNAKKKNFWWS